jgi:hypothetical protein
MNRLLQKRSAVAWGGFALVPHATSAFEGATGLALGDA